VQASEVDDPAADPHGRQAERAALGVRHPARHQGKTTAHIIIIIIIIIVVVIMSISSSNSSSSILPPVMVIITITIIT
jgi:lipopolysaccharide export LptBFGC system permease protein LptF